jgi:isoleucyl-tRNA synthetase
MDLGRDVCSSVLALREARKRRTRLPLKSLTVAHSDADVLNEYRDIIAEAINVKSIVFTEDVGAFGSRDIKVNSKLGARIGPKFKELLAAQRSRNWVMREDGRIEIAGLIVDPQDFVLRLRTTIGANDEVTRRAKDGRKPGDGHAVPKTRSRGARRTDANQAMASECREQA